MELHSLQQAMDVQRAVQVVQADHETERDEVRRQRVHEAAAEGIARQRPPQRVDDRVERLPRLPQLLDAEREELRILARHTLPRAPRLGQEASCPFRQHRHLGGEVVRGEIVAERAALAIEAARRRAHPHDAAAVHEQARRREAGEHVHAQRLGLLAQPADDLAQRGDVVAAVAHRGGSRKAPSAVSRQQIHGLPANRRAEWEVRIGQLGEQLAEWAWIDHRAREAMLAERRGFFQHADVELGAVPPGETRQLDRGRQPGGPGSDDQHVQLHPIARAGGADRKDEPVQWQGRLVLRRNEPLPAPCSLSHVAF